MTENSVHPASSTESTSMDENMIQLYGHRDMCLVKGEGSWVWDSRGNKYLDCISGVAVNALGHAFPEVKEAVSRQLEKYSHVSNLYLTEAQAELSSLLTEISGLDKVFFCNSGTEANEAAIKFARKFWFRQGKPEKIEIITFENSFHGRTYGSLAATGQDSLKEGFGPMPEGFVTIPLNNPEALEKAIGKGTAAVLVEPVLAEGGVLSLSESLISAINKARELDILVICDEIQTGLGRGGAFFASKEIGLQTDMVTMAKALGGGLPLGAVLVDEKIAAQLAKGDHGSTFGGNPLSCAAGAAVIKILQSPGFMNDIAERSRYFRDSLLKMIASLPGCGLDSHILGMGFLIGIPFHKDLNALLQICREEGLLAYRAGKNVLRLLPPLTIKRSEIDQIIETLRRSLIQLG